MTPLRLAIAGIGSAGRSLLGPIAARNDVDLVAVADPNPDACADVCRRFSARYYSTLQELVRDCDVDAVYIATPTDLHERHVLIAAGAGKHILVEKPIAAAMDQAERMIAAASRANVVLLVGHSHSYDTPYAVMRDHIRSGRMGAVRMMHSICYTDWMYRPRRPEELDTSLGGGVAYRQGAHQFDILRLLGGGLVQTVRAYAFDWDPLRRGMGAYSATLTFSDGAVATAVYNGYGAFLSPEICFDIGEVGHVQGPEEAGRLRRSFGALDGAAELQAKRTRAARRLQTPASFQPFFGWLIVSCEGGDLRQSPSGLFLYTAQGRDELPLPVAASTRDAMLAELLGTIRGERVPLHDGRWGLATLEVCAAVVESAASGRDVALSRQISAER